MKIDKIQKTNPCCKFQNKIVKIGDNKFLKSLCDLLRNCTLYVSEKNIFLNAFSNFIGKPQTMIRVNLNMGKFDEESSFSILSRFFSFNFEISFSIVRKKFLKDSSSTRNLNKCWERNTFIWRNRPYQGLVISTKGNIPLSD